MLYPDTFIRIYLCKIANVSTGVLSLWDSDCGLTPDAISWKRGE